MIDRQQSSLIRGLFPRKERAARPQGVLFSHPLKTGETKMDKSMITAALIGGMDGKEANPMRAAMMLSAITGRHIRVGLEDNVRDLGKQLAKGSWQQVEYGVQI